MTPSESIKFYTTLVKRHTGAAKLAHELGLTREAERHEALARAAKQFLVVAEDKAKNEGTQNEDTSQ